MLLKTSPPLVVIESGPPLVCQTPTVFPNEQVGNTVLTHYAQPADTYWQANGYQLDGTIGYDTITCEAMRSWSDYNGGSFFWNWHDKGAGGVPVNGRSFLLMIDLTSFTRVPDDVDLWYDPAPSQYNGENYTWPPEFMINIIAYTASGPYVWEATDTRYLRMDGSCYRGVSEDDTNYWYTAPNYVYDRSVDLFNIDEVGLTADGNTYVCRFTMKNIDPSWRIGNNGVWLFGPVFPGSCRFALYEYP